MENQDFNSKMTEIYREMAKKVSNFDVLHNAFDKLIQKKEQYQKLDADSLRKLAYTIMQYEQLTEIKRKKRNMVIIEGEISPLSDEEIASIMDYTPDKPESKQNQSVRYVKICAQICRLIKDKKIKRFFVYRYVMGLKTPEIAGKFGLKEEDRKGVKRLSDKFEEVIKRLPTDLIDDLQYYQGIVRGDRRNTAVGDLVDIVAGGYKFPKTKENFSWSRLKSLSGETKELPDFVDDYKEKLDTDNNELIMQAILTDNPMPDDRMPLQIPYRLRITARKQTI